MPLGRTYKAYAAVAILIALLAGVAALAAVPFLQVAGLEDEIAEKQKLLPELRAKVAHEDKLRKEHEELSALGQDKSLLLEGDKTGVAGANLQSLVNSLVAANGGTASSIQILPPKEDGNLMRISVSVSINVGTQGLRDIIHTLETGMPLIFIDDVSVQAIHDDFRPPEPHYMGPLEVTLQVSGFAAQGGGAS
ncbi:General secretion pathway protein M [Hyphomicrobium denitrificans ATCC 51888]|uniref:General secretion pathway protein M n=1 Tax=Hyphomicrobium denitrificans (strain ATCC 51888 / DSM 1869 / NCIMB 11706 / TK 0415) TaxID=582899 RepID=D8JQJ2_HYPDA|nr:type II secretion system protein GspM [Hyphomicrobium denitrificans]ADJ23946.1 General secretion pathway protein M [Hyphomicrobium denitrificans ATCC 51888]